MKTEADVISDGIKLSIVFLNYNRQSETRQTVEQLKKITANRRDIEIIAVDNGSSDGTVNYLKQQNVISVLLADNSGIAGYNKGFEITKGEYILVLDDDSSPADVDCIDKAIESLDQNSDIGLIACHIETPDGKAQWSWHLPCHYLRCRSPFFVGCGFFIRRELFKKIGWYPEDFFLYQNEIEVSFQVRMQGFDIIYDPACIVIHRGFPNQRAHWRRIFFPTRNTLWLLRKYYRQPWLSYLIISRLLIGFVRALQFGELNCYFNAVYQGFNRQVKKDLLPSDLLPIFSPFFKQNSIIHQLLDKI
ncbi:MAG: glycosyltransferase [Methylomonas sp.]|nr:glycosyltransferase [Methylomonas sp.]